MKWLTFIKRLAQLGSHTPIRRAVRLQGDGHKQGGVRGFWGRAVRWNMSARYHSRSLLLFTCGNTARSHITAMSAAACAPGANVALEPRKQVHTPVNRHHCEPFTSGELAPFADCGLDWFYCNSSSMLFIQWTCEDYYTPPTSTEDGQHSLPASTTWDKTSLCAGAHKCAYVIFRVKWLALKKWKKITLLRELLYIWEIESLLFILIKI